MIDRRRFLASGLYGAGALATGIYWQSRFGQSGDPVVHHDPEGSALQVFPPDNAWNTPVTDAPVDPLSALYISTIGADTPLHPDFGTVWDGAPLGIPYIYVHSSQPKVPVTFTYNDESDPGPYPIPDNAPIEGGPNSDGDRHVLVIDVDSHILYELYNARKTSDGWSADSGAIYHLDSNKLRPAGWTSADAAGLPIFPGLVRYDELERDKAIRHALRFTCQHTQRAYVYPARHFASKSSNPSLPPMGMRVRLRADFDTSSFSSKPRIILKALKEYGMFLADNGGNWFLSGAPDPRWSDEVLHTLTRVHGRDFEVIRMDHIVRAGG
ncbi:MAG: hypothetical protein KGJ62_08190 [Armatimonadetes bacterium]|nr:hypothetical protein [Armatimonadota bacterium]MDE2205256.1 hypothetical protein [Armatimonadota bacterium]